MAGCSKEFKDYKIGEMSDMDGVNNCPTCATNLSNYVQCLQSIKKVEYKLGMAKWRIERDKLRIKQLEEKTEYLEHPLSATERIKQLEDVLKKISIQKCSCLDCKSKVFMAQKALEK